MEKSHGNSKVLGPLAGLVALTTVTGVSVIASECGDKSSSGMEIASSEDPRIQSRSRLRSIFTSTDDTGHDIDKEEDGLNAGKVVLMNEDGTVKNPRVALQECIQGDWDIACAPPPFFNLTCRNVDPDKAFASVTVYEPVDYDKLPWLIQIGESTFEYDVPACDWQDQESLKEVEGVLSDMCVEVKDILNWDERKFCDGIAEGQDCDNYLYGLRQDASWGNRSMQLIEALDVSLNEDGIVSEESSPGRLTVVIGDEEFFIDPAREGGVLSETYNVTYLVDVYRLSGDGYESSGMFSAENLVWELHDIQENGF